MLSVFSVMTTLLSVQDSKAAGLIFSKVVAASDFREILENVDDME